jgi:very-short-patch-repair endonuclease
VVRDKLSIGRARALRREPTRAEKVLWNRIRAHRLNGWGFRRQAPVIRYIVDFLCHDLHLVIEIDGPIHDEPEQIAYDKQRTRDLEAAGFVVIRVREHVVRDATDHAWTGSRPWGNQSPQALHLPRT